MRAHRNVERRLNRERLVPVLSASTLSSDFIPYPLVSSPFLANNCPFLLEPSVAGSWARLPFWNATKSFLSLSFLSFFFGFLIMSDRRKIFRNRKIDIADILYEFEFFPYGRYVMSTRSRVSYTSVSHVPQILYLSISLPLPRAKTRGKEMNFTDGGGKEKKRKEGKENVEICFHRGRKRNLQLETR